MLVTLMHQNDEVLEFDIDLKDQAVLHIRPLDAPELAPSAIFGGAQDSNELLGRFVQSRALHRYRPDLGRILEATKAVSAVELAVRAGGFSLSDQYWYRTQPGALTWQGSNFFRNAWDTAFGEAVLAGDFAVLSKADVATPDVTCGGSQRKAWLFLDGAPHLLKVPSDGNDAALVGEVLASRMLELLLATDDFVPHELVERNGMTCSFAPLFVREGVDLLAASSMGSFEERIGSDGAWKSPNWENLERTLDGIGIEGGRSFLAKLSVASSLCLYGDIHVDNLGVMRDCTEGTLRLAPLYDLDGAFGTYSREVVRHAQANRELALRFVSWGYRNLVPSWDYSWCDLAPLDGFGETVERMLGQCDEIGDGYPAFARELFEAQLDYVASVVTR